MWSIDPGHGPPGLAAETPPVREEHWNALTHAVGLVASLVGGAALVTLSAASGNLRQLIAASVYSATLVLLYAASTLYHATTHPGAKARLRVLDHCAIFLLIAGTYTPFTLVSLHGSWGSGLFGTIWALTLLGIAFKLFFTGRFEFASTLFYVALGWMAVVAYRPLMEAVPAAALGWLLAGGISYTVGTVFFRSRRIPYAHAIWHLFVLGGSVCHFIAVLTEML